MVYQESPLEEVIACVWKNQRSLLREGTIELSFGQFGKFVRKRRGFKDCLLKMKFPESFVFQQRVIGHFLVPGAK